MNHAMTVAGNTNAAVYLLHVVDKAAHVEEARLKLAIEAERARKWNNKVSVTPIVRVRVDL